MSNDYDHDTVGLHQGYSQGPANRNRPTNQSTKTDVVGVRMKTDAGGQCTELTEQWTARCSVLGLGVGFSVSNETDRWVPSGHFHGFQQVRDMDLSLSRSLSSLSLLHLDLRKSRRPTSSLSVTVGFFENRKPMSETDTDDRFIDRALCFSVRCLFLYP